METLGLSTRESQELLQRHGLNLVKGEKRVVPVTLLVGQFKSPLVLILLGACVLSLLLGEWIEGVAIAGILVINALIGFFQEYRAETAVEALMQMTAPHARVLRDGKTQEILAIHVVPGDILLLEAGDVVAADGEIVQASRLQVNEAVLTGESVPVDKFAGGKEGNGHLGERKGSVFMGTSVALGTAMVRVTGTGMNTELGKIAHLINTAEDTATPLQVELERVGKMLLALCLVVVGIVFAMGYIQGRPWLELTVFAISLAVAAVPEGMPAIVTVALAFGVQRMARQNALIRKLPSVETLGSVSVICTDKTGTLTSGQMRVREIWGRDHNRVIRVAAACCDAELADSHAKHIGDPTEIAILLSALERGIDKATIESQNPRIKTHPFDSERKMMSILRNDGRNYVKGAFESIFARVVASDLLNEAHAALNDMTSRGLRVIAVAEGQGEREENLEFVGVIGIADPPRTEVMDAISVARRAGILPVMITGDHPVTAAAIARELGLLMKNEPIEGKVHARATPEDKLKIVREWKQRGAIVAMTGDGVNDAPALREAHIGIAMGITGTQVTKQAADLVLADDNFATIVAAVREGRGVYQNIRKAIVYLLTGNFAELVAVVSASILGLPVPFLASHLLWINLVTDSLPGLALIADPTSPDLMNEQPRPSGERMLGRPQWLKIAGIGTIEAISVGALYWIQLDRHGIEDARNMAFTALVSSQLLRSFGARSRRRSAWQMGFFSNGWLIAVVILTFILQISLHFIPLTQAIFGLKPIGWIELQWILPFAIVPLLFLELTKFWQRRRTAPL
jgi:Ca2+-transporting ATPase